VGVGVAAVVWPPATPEDRGALGVTRDEFDLVADWTAGGGPMTDDDDDGGLGAVVVGSGRPRPPCTPGMEMPEMPPTGDGQWELVDARLTPVTVAAASAHSPMSRELGTLRRQVSNRCHLERTTGCSGNSSLWTISSHCGPAWMRALTERVE
jgi:hypothetical protein